MPQAEPVQWELLVARTEPELQDVLSSTHSTAKTVSFFMHEQQRCVQCQTLDILNEQGGDNKQLFKNVA